MAEPTLRDVLAAIAAMRAEMATKDALAAVDAKVDAHRAETAAGFAALDAELSDHSAVAHRNIEKDIIALHRPLVRAKIAGIPAELPSEVRRRDGKPATAKKRTARRR